MLQPCYVWQAPDQELVLWALDGAGFRFMRTEQGRREYDDTIATLRLVPRLAYLEARYHLTIRFVITRLVAVIPTDLSLLQITLLVVID